MKQSFFISPDGDTMEAVHTDVLDSVLSSENKQVTRASNVEFDEEQQSWCAKLEDRFGGTTVYGKNRKQVLEIEHVFVEGGLRNEYAKK